jgi:hypothetical protein
VGSWASDGVCAGAGVLVRAPAAQHGVARGGGGVDVHHAAHAAQHGAAAAAGRHVQNGEPQEPGSGKARRPSGLL